MLYGFLNKSFYCLVLIMGIILTGCTSGTSMPNASTVSKTTNEAEKTIPIPVQGYLDDLVGTRGAEPIGTADKDAEWKMVKEESRRRASSEEEDELFRASVYEYGSDGRISKQEVMLNDAPGARRTYEYSKNREVEYFESYNRNGDVFKQLKTVTEKRDDGTQCVEQFEGDGSLTISSEEESEPIESGRRLTRTVMADGETKVYTSEYDKNDNKIKSKTALREEGRDVEISHAEYKYDELNREIEFHVYRNDEDGYSESAEYTSYGADGDRIVLHVSDAESSYPMDTTYAYYTSEGYLLYAKQEEDGSETAEESFVEYNKDGLPASITTISGYLLKNKRFFVYDSHGNLILTTNTLFDYYSGGTSTSLFSATAYTYENVKTGQISSFENIDEAPFATYESDFPAPDKVNSLDYVSTRSGIISGEWEAVDSLKVDESIGTVKMAVYKSDDNPVMTVFGYRSDGEELFFSKAEYSRMEDGSIHVLSCSGTRFVLRPLDGDGYEIKGLSLGDEIKISGALTRITGY